MSHLALVPNGALAVRPCRVNSELAAKTFREQLQRRRNKLTCLATSAVMALALVLLILAAALPNSHQWGQRGPQNHFLTAVTKVAA